MILKINLLPPEYKKKRRSIGLDLKLPSFENLSEKQHYLPVPVALIALIFIGYMYITAEKEINHLREKKESIEAEIRKYESIAVKIDTLNKEFKEFEEKKKKLEISVELYRHIVSADIKTPRILSKIISAIPSGTWLEKVELSPEKNIVSGYSFSPSFIVVYTRNLSTDFVVNFNSTDSKTSQGDRVFYSFSFELINKDTEIQKDEHRRD